MSKYTGYDEKSKSRTMKYNKEKRDHLNLNLPLGSKDRYKEYAKTRGFKSFTEMVIYLIEKDIDENK